MKKQNNSEPIKIRAKNNGGRASGIHFLYRGNYNKFEH